MNVRRPIMILAFLGLMSWTLPILSSANAEGLESDYRDWISALRSAVLTAQAWDGDPEGTKYSSYLGQLHVTDAWVQRGDHAATYTAMNRFMEMLENREHGIASAWADWLLDYCLAVTPPQFHDLSRHIRKVMSHELWEPVASQPEGGLI